jgi:hypothetical protein
MKANLTEIWTRKTADYSGVEAVGVWIMPPAAEATNTSPYSQT